MSTVVRLGGIAVALGILVACAKPRVISDITLADGQVKMIYERVGTGETGMIQCRQLPDGTLADCKALPIVFAE